MEIGQIAREVITANVVITEQKSRSKDVTAILLMDSLPLLRVTVRSTECATDEGI